MSVISKKQFFRAAIVGILCIFYLLLGYGLFYEGWWKFIPSVALIAATVALAYPNKSKSLLGLTSDRREIVEAIGIFVFGTPAAALLIAYALQYPYAVSLRDLIDYPVVFFQTLCEELVFRSLLLSAIARITNKPFYILVLPALFFSVLHQVLYGFLMVGPNRGWLDLSTLATLFFFGFSCNCLFWQRHSIWRPWAIHCAWNLNRFGSYIVDKLDIERRIPEYVTFNLLEGTTPILVASLLFAIVCAKRLYYNKMHFLEINRI